MSAFFDEAVTPCPSRSRSSLDSLIDDDSSLEPTGQIEYTTEVRAPTLTGVRPRRANRTGSAFQILEDVIQKPAGPVEKRRRPNGAIKPSDRKSSLLAQPAQRFRPKVNAAPSASPRPVKQKTETQPKSRGVEGKTSRESLHVPPKKDAQLEQHSQDTGLKKNVRRNTVYIPPDDSTVASVFMGLFSPLKKPDGESLPPLAEDTQVNTLEKRIVQRQARKSLAVSARRAPLQPSKKIAQEAAFRVDVAGKNGGKENIPPGTFVDSEKKTSEFLPPTKPSRLNTVPAQKHVRLSNKLSSPNSKPAKAVAAAPKEQKPARGVLGEKQSNVKPSQSRSDLNKAVATGPTPPVMSASLDARASALSNRLGCTASSRASRIESVPPKLKRLNHEYPSLTEDIPKPALYEDNWLSHQETVITQLVNALFECTNGDSNAYDPNGMRLELLGLYHTDYFAQLYRRLQSSLSFGNLSTYKELLSRSNRLRHDVGLKRKFLDIWLQSYDLRALVAAVETVVGRKVFNDNHLQSDDANTPQNNATKRNRVMLKKLEGFLDAFLLHNDDVDQALHSTNDISETHMKAYRRTVLRSIILVVLLDQGKQCSSANLPQRLFVSSSSFKSSAALLQALIGVLLPSCGDITKPLGHLGCRLSYQQHELQEYNYQMENIAVDLRDGVRLTRLVEALFFTSENAQSDPDQTEVTLNTGEALCLLGDEKDLPLSKHLKYPCVSRAAKIFNVQIALSALESVRGSSAIVSTVRAEDIVDGYREKTIALLWALVSKWGLAGLVDWDDVSKEISRLERKALSQVGVERARSEAWFTEETFDDSDRPAYLLQKWATILAALKGLPVNNMTTSFADGRIYESIVDEYEPYITGNSHGGGLETSIRSAPVSLESRLRLLGCSSQFGTSHIQYITSILY